MIPEKIKNMIPPLRATAFDKDPIVYAKLFHPLSKCQWYITEYDQMEDLCFGLVAAFENEIGYFSLQELREINVGGLPIEIDRFWKPTPLSIVKAAIKNR
ncbi:MAG: DUF2958 domain-containing protein [Oligoflexia bacterium]|nr:DUF2958 domain-containing protein [Oligoflexia bacterium]